MTDPRTPRPGPTRRRATTFVVVSLLGLALTVGLLISEGYSLSRVVLLACFVTLGVSNALALRQRP